MRARFAVVAAVSTLAVGGCGGLEYYVDTSFLKPNQTVFGNPNELHYQYDTIYLPMGDTDQVAIWYVHTELPRKGIVVVLPGLADNKSRYVLTLPIFVDDGWDTILVDYAGFGESTGPATLARAVDSSRVAFDYAIAQDPNVVGFGFSFGTAVLARLAADMNIDACIFDGTANLWKATTLFVNRNIFPTPLTWIMDAFTQANAPTDYDTLRWIKQVNQPKLFIHSPTDRLNPFEGAWEVYQAAPYPKYFFMVEGEHVTEEFTNPVLFREVVDAWLDGVMHIGPPLSPELTDLVNSALRSYLDDLQKNLPFIQWDSQLPP